MRQKHDRVQAWQTEGALACDSGYVLHEVKTRGSKSGDSCQDGDPKGSHPCTFYVQEGRDSPKADEITKMANPRCCVTVDTH